MQTPQGNELADKAVFRFVAALAAVNAFNDGNHAECKKHKHSFELVAHAISPAELDIQSADLRERVRSKCMLVLHRCASGCHNYTTQMLPVSVYVQLHTQRVLDEGTQFTSKQSGR